MCMCDMCVSDMFLGDDCLGCGVLCRAFVCVKMSMCVLCRSVWGVCSCGCVCSYMSCYVYVRRCLCINSPKLGVFYCLCVC